MFIDWSALSQRVACDNIGSQAGCRHAHAVFYCFSFSFYFFPLWNEQVRIPYCLKANWLRAYFNYTWCLSTCEDVEGHSTTKPLHEEHLNYRDVCRVHLSYQFYDLRVYFLFSSERSAKRLIASYCYTLAQFSRKLSAMLEDYRSSSLRVPYCNV